MGGDEVRRRMSDDAAVEPAPPRPTTRACAASASPPPRSRLIADQAFKLWLLFVFAIESRGGVRVTPFFDLVLVWNTGISYGLFPADGTFGQMVLCCSRSRRSSSSRSGCGGRPDHGLLRSGSG